MNRRVLDRPVRVGDLLEYINTFDRVNTSTYEVTRMTDTHVYYSNLGAIRHEFETSLYGFVLGDWILIERVKTNRKSGFSEFIRRHEGVPT